MDARLRSIAAALAAMVVVVAIQACSAAPPSTLSVPSPSPVATSEPSAPPATAAPTASPVPPPNAAPVELQGKWGVDLAPGDHATLRIGETVYSISRGGTSIGGKISVDGDMIKFFGAAACLDGVGNYRWAIAGDILTFTPVGDRDPCPRTDVLLKELKRVPS